MNADSARTEKIDTIRRLPAQLAAVVNRLDDARLDTPYGPGKWTIRQVVHHLADSHMNAFIRMKLALTEDTPTVKTYDQERWAETVEACAMPIAPSMSIITGLHERWAAMLNEVAEADWQRPVHHPERGTLVLDDFLHIYSNHCTKHLGHITDLVDAMGW